MTLAEGLKRARQLLEVGWCPFMPRDAHGTICPRGHEDAKQWPIDDALHMGVSGDFDLLMQAEGLVHSIATLGMPEPRPLLFRWEEMPGRTQQDVLRVMSRAIQRASAIKKRGAA